LQLTVTHEPEPVEEEHAEPGLAGKVMLAATRPGNRELSVLDNANCTSLRENRDGTTLTDEPCMLKVRVNVSTVVDHVEGVGARVRGLTVGAFFVCSERGDGGLTSAMD